MKTVLVPIARHALIEPTLETAALLARAFDSYVEGFALVQDLPLLVTDAPGGGIIGYSDPEPDAEVTRACRALFERQMRAREVPANAGGVPGLSFGWTEDRAGTGDGFVGTYGRAFNIIVVGRPGAASDGPRMGTLEAALFGTGRPILIAPPTAPATIGENILIAWNGSTEAARTIGFAKPFLSRAREVTIASVEGGQVPGPTAEQIARHFRLNGIACDVRHLKEETETKGAAFLAEAARRGCDLLIKGAYTQGRLRQMIFGGATRHIIVEANLPVLMAH